MSSALRTTAFGTQVCLSSRRLLSNSARYSCLLLKVGNLVVSTLEYDDWNTVISAFEFDDWNTVVSTFECDDFLLPGIVCAAEGRGTGHFHF